MKINLNLNFVIFGEFDEIYNNFSDIALRFSDFSKFANQEATPSNNVQTVYIMQKNKERVQIRNNRIDYTFFDFDDNVINEYIKIFSCFCSNLFGINFNKNIINRIGLNSSYFYEDKKPSFDLFKKHLSNTFKDDCSDITEFFLRTNTPFAYQKKLCNFVVTEAFKTIQNSFNFTFKIGLQFNFDLNTALENNFIEYSPEKIFSLSFFDFFNDKVKKFLQKIDRYE